MEACDGLLELLPIVTEKSLALKPVDLMASLNVTASKVADVLSISASLNEGFYYLNLYLNY